MGAQLNLLVKKLLPNGRVYNALDNTNVDKLIVSINGNGSLLPGTTEKFLADCDNVLDAILPINDNFTDGTTNPNDNDCNDWERRLGITQWGITSASTPTKAQRIAAIKTAYRYPGTTKPRQSASYLQSQLQSAGFNVFVFENLDNLSPADVTGLPIGDATYGAIDYGTTDYGASLYSVDVTICANHIDQAQDEDFYIPAGNYHGTFFICNAILGQFQDVPLIQRNQFRQLILKLKPAHMVAYLLINYI